uniref:XRE family transcriptional regulator n=1 Tax=Heterorhabditis bacteriophora TaxID=37862 RepID=A0A1I7X006_HETBA
MKVKQAKVGDLLHTSRSGTRRLSPDERDRALRGIGIRVPIVEALFLRTKLKRNGPELSEAMLVPIKYAILLSKKVDSLKPTLDLDDR